jgi:hypothetical protein
MTDRIIVTDHAIVRYLERIAGVDIEGLREEIKKETELAGGVLGNGKFMIGGGFRAVVSDGRVVTIIESKG